MVAYGEINTCNAAAVIGKQVRRIKRCDQIVIAGFKRCDASTVSTVAMQ